MKRKTIEKFFTTSLILLVLSICPFAMFADEGELFTVEIKTKGKGRVTLTPEGGEYPSGTEVTVTAVAEKGFTFAKWGEDLEGFAVTKTVVIEEELEIEAHFKRAYKKGIVQNTDYGKVKGQRERFADHTNSNIDYDILSWRGIPFAAPPVGELRWKAPREPESWTGVKEFRSNGGVSTQVNSFTGELMGGEDCLYLNIFRPNTSEEGLPVYFWIHGGANISGHAGEYENLANFAERTNSVVVVTQYRLGDMGIFYNEELEGSELDRTGNFIILDQIKALQWVRDNIEYFGGTPENVTIAGQSAGAHNVMGLLVSPLAEGLFHKAVYQSGGGFFITKEEALNSSKGTVKALQQKLAAEGKTDLDRDELFEHVKEADSIELLGLRGPTSAYGLIIDGTIIPDDPYKLLKEGKYNKVPIIIGGCKEELNYLNALMFSPLTAYVNQTMGTNIPDYSRLVPMIVGGEDLYTHFSRAEIDSFIAGNSVLNRVFLEAYVHKLARLFKERQDDVYLYQFNWDSDNGSPYQEVFGAGHAIEIPFFHGGGTVDMWGLGFIYSEATRAGREELERVMTGQMGSFIHSGAPNGADLPLWEPLVKGESPLKVMALDSRDSNNTGYPAFQMFEQALEYQQLYAEGMALEGKDQAAFDMFRAYLQLMRLTR